MRHSRISLMISTRYPSLLESSDVDGGTSVAVLTYLRHILESIDHPDLIRLTLSYLFGVKDDPPKVESSARPTALARRRKSEGLLSHHATGADEASPVFFNLADLMLASLRSKSQQTLGATLRLLSTLLQKQHSRAQAALLKTRLVKHTDQSRTIGGQDKEVDTLLSMAEDLGDLESLEDSYQKYLQDDRAHLEDHSCSSRLWQLTASGDLELKEVSPGESLMKMHFIVPEDPVLRGLLALFASFFTNDLETNLGLTQVLVDMASCGYTRLEGWFLTDPKNYIYTDSGRIEDSSSCGRSNSLKTYGTLPRRPQLAEDTKARCAPSWEIDDVSPVLEALEKLVGQAESFRWEIQDFDAHLRECRAIIGADEDTGMVSRPKDAFRKSKSATDVSPSRIKSTDQIGSISQRLQSERLSDGDSRNSSPRGRQLDTASTPVLVGRLSHLHMSPSRASSQNSSRAYSPSPIRNQSAASTPAKSKRTFRRAGEALRRRIQIPNKASLSQHDHTRDFPSSEASSIRSDSVGPKMHSEAIKDVSLGHLLTNVIILQEFILELAALVEIRASMFKEVRFS